MPKVAGASKALWTPGGMVSTRERGIVDLAAGELRMLASLHDFAQRHGIVVLCKACDSAITGRNADTDEHFEVSCKCRSFRFKKPR